MSHLFVTVKDDMQPELENVQAAADNDTYYGTGVSMIGYQGVVFFAVVGAGNAGTVTLKAQQDTSSAFSTAADLEGTAVSIITGTQANGFAFVEVKNPQEDYVRPALVVPDWTAVPAIMISLRYGKNWRPETNADGEFHYSPAEGTA